MAENGKITRIRRGRKAKDEDGEEDEARVEHAATRHAKAPEVQATADGLIPSPGLALKFLAGAKIAYEFTTQKQIGCNGFVATRLWPAWARPWGKFDFLIIAAKLQWDTADERTRQAAIAHALSHCAQSDRGIWQLADHDYEDFGTVAKRFGAWSESGRVVAQQLRLLDPERDAFARVEARADGIITTNGQQAAD